jgi:osmotically-inducible protein OsmY
MRADTERNSAADADADADDDLRQAVIATLMREPSEEVARIGVSVCGGDITLIGSVSSYAVKWGAEQAARRAGGRAVRSEGMHVAVPGSCRRADADISRSAESVLRWMTVLPMGSVQVAVEAGCITLSGIVDRGYQKQAAVGGVRHLMGVTGVSDRIALRA